MILTFRGAQHDSQRRIMETIEFVAVQPHRDRD
jgi:hypothetical protein